MISIKKVKEISEELKLTNLVIFGISEDGKQHVATHGKTNLQAQESATMGNDLKRKLLWPEKYCNSKPLERICENCSFYKYPDHRDLQYGAEGKCMFEAKLITRDRNAIACGHFQPKY